MWRIVLAAAVLTLAAGPARTDEAEDAAAIEAARAAIGAAYETEDEATIRGLVIPDHIAIAPMYGGAAILAEQFALFGEITYTAYDPTPPEVTLLDARTALVNYRISLDGTFRGAPLASPIYVTEIWVKRKGKWLQHLYQETPVGGG